MSKDSAGLGSSNSNLKMSNALRALSAAKRGLSVPSLPPNHPQHQHQHQHHPSDTVTYVVNPLLSPEPRHAPPPVIPPLHLPSRVISVDSIVDASSASKRFYQFQMAMLGPRRVGKTTCLANLLSLVQKGGSIGLGGVMLQPGVGNSAWGKRMARLPSLLLSQPMGSKLSISGQSTDLISSAEAGGSPLLGPEVIEFAFSEGRTSVRAYDFAPESIDMFPFYVYKRTLVLLVFNASTELEQPAISSWLKEICQVSRHHNTSSLSSSLSSTSRGGVESPHQRNFDYPKVFLIGTHADKISNKTQHKLEKRIKELQRQFCNVQAFFFVSASKSSVNVLKKAIKKEALFHEELVQSVKSSLPPVAGLLQHKLETMRSQERTQNNGEEGEFMLGMPIIDWKRFKKMCREEFGLSKVVMHKCLSFWTDLGFVYYIQHKKKKGSWQSGDSLTLRDFVILDYNWLAHAYSLLLRAARYPHSFGLPREKRIPAGLKLDKKKGQPGLVLTKHLAEIWGDELGSQKPRQVVLMVLEELELLHFVIQKKQKVLVLSGDMESSRASPISLRSAERLVKRGKINFTDTQQPVVCNIRDDDDDEEEEDEEEEDNIKERGDTTTANPDRISRSFSSPELVNEISSQVTQGISLPRSLKFLGHKEVPHLSISNAGPASQKKKVSLHIDSLISPRALFGSSHHHLLPTKAPSPRVTRSTSGNSLLLFRHSSNTSLKEEVPMKARHEDAEKLSTEKKNSSEKPRIKKRRKRSVSDAAISSITADTTTTAKLDGSAPIKPPLALSDLLSKLQEDEESTTQNKEKEKDKKSKMKKGQKKELSKKKEKKEKEDGGEKAIRRKKKVRKSVSEGELIERWVRKEEILLEDTGARPKRVEEKKKKEKGKEETRTRKKKDKDVTAKKEKKKSKDKERKDPDESTQEKDVIIRRTASERYTVDRVLARSHPPQSEDLDDREGREERPADSGLKYGRLAQSGFASIRRSAKDKTDTGEEGENVSEIGSSESGLELPVKALSHRQIECAKDQKERLVRMRRLQFQTVYRNVGSIEKDLKLWSDAHLQDVFSNVGSAATNTPSPLLYRAPPMVRIGTRAQDRLLLPKAIPASLTEKTTKRGRGFLSGSSKREEESGEDGDDDNHDDRDEDEQESDCNALRSAGWSPPLNRFQSLNRGTNNSPVEKETEGGRRKISITQKLVVQERRFIYRGHICPPWNCLPPGLFPRLVARFMEMEQGRRCTSTVRKPKER